MPSSGFKPANGWSSVIRPSEYGSEIISRLEIDKEKFSEDEVSFALLLTFFHHDFLINVSASSSQGAESLLAQELANKTIRLPDRFGRMLYDRFNDTLDSSRPEYLEADAVDALLNETEQGIYQIGTLTTGPLGPLQSRDRRYIPPIRRLPLWHCADTGCGQVHTVQLIPHSSASYELADLITGAAINTQGPPSEWSTAFAKLSSHVGPRRGRPYYDLPALIADCIPIGERAILCTEALRGSTGPALRQTLSQIDKSIPQGSAETVARKISAVAQIQLLLTLNDTELVFLIDDCIKRKLIKIPPTEARKVTFAPPRLSSFDEGSTICMFGVRADDDNPPVLISRSVWEEYERIDQLEDLAWRCKRRGGNSSYDSGSPLDYIISNGPHDFVKNLILPSRPVTLGLANKFRICFDESEPEEQFINRILWKFGFNPPRYELKYGRLKGQLRQLRDEVLRHRSVLTEDDRDSIRASGVNVFVAIENILEEIVAFNVWLLSSDHFVATRFEYSLAVAVSQVADVLGDCLNVGGHEFVWNRKGGNVLGTLLVYARTATSWMNALSDRDKADIERPIDELPHYVGEISQQFRFRHRELWADAAPNQLREFAERFGNLISDFERSRLAEVRNGLEHYRNEDKFPAIDVIIACESRLSAAIDMSDINRFLPKYFWMQERRADSFGMIERTLADYAGNKITIRAPQPLAGLLTPGFKSPVVIPFGNLLGMPNSDLVFQVREDSEYSKLWDNYPRRSNAEMNSVTTIVDSMEGEGMIATVADKIETIVIVEKSNL